MSNILEYYKNYHKNGGNYFLEKFKGSSRHLMIGNWLVQYLPEGATILDIGCGDGSYSHWFPQFNWIGLDINEEKDKYRGKRHAIDIEQTPYEFINKESLDAVICSEVLEHLWAPEKVHKEANRVLKPKGLYIISTPNYNWVEHVYGGFKQVLYSTKDSHLKEHVRFFTPETHVLQLREAGFNPIEMMGADLQFGTFFQEARAYMKGAFPDKEQGELDWMLGQMFKCVAHTIGVLSVKS